jgi:hypothetical protein
MKFHQRDLVFQVFFIAALISSPGTVISCPFCKPENVTTSLRVETNVSPIATSAKMYFFLDQKELFLAFNFVKLN